MIFKMPFQPTERENITFVITDDCNLRCKYCFETNKQPNHMTKQTAKDCIDYFFEQYKPRKNQVLFDFFGGEPLLHPELLDFMIYYILKKQSQTKHWKQIFMSIMTNGTQFSNLQVKRLIKKYHNNITIGLSLDGCKIAHNINRCNSFDTIIKDFPYWRNNFPLSGINSVINHESLPYLFESIKFLHSTCLQYMYMNLVSENVWQDNDDKLLYEQMIKSADYIIDNNLYKDKFCSLFHINLILDKKYLEHDNYCCVGTSTITVDYKGDLFPCINFKTTSKEKPLIIGNIYKNGGKIDYKKLLPFYFCYNLKLDFDCKKCDLNNKCPRCTAFCYDETGSIFKKPNYTCKMLQSLYKADLYYWNKLANKENKTINELLELNNEPNNELNKKINNCDLCYR